MHTLLTIAGFDPSSGAGISADLMVFAAHGLFGTACITGLTVQSTLGVRAVHPVAGEIVADTLNCLDADLRASGIKIGMLSNLDNVIRISDYIEQLRQTRRSSDSAFRQIVVLDPVLRSTSGRELLDSAGLEALRHRLLPLVDWVTPNLQELGVLVSKPVIGHDDMRGACAALQADLARDNAGKHLGILATGGHLDHPDDYLLKPSGEGCWLRGERVDTRSTHGTGCALSSAFLSRLVLGETPLMAATGAKEYVAGALQNATPIGTGIGPMNYLWQLGNPLR